MAMVVFGVAALGVLLTAAVGMFCGSYLKVSEQSKSWRGGCFFMQVSQTLIYHTAFLQMKSYYTTRNTQLDPVTTQFL